MTPEYIERLADLVDPHALWRVPAFERDNLTDEERAQLDAGVALRRHADHVRRLNALLGQNKSLLITPLSESVTATKIVPIPDSHLRLLKREGGH